MMTKSAHQLLWDKEFIEKRIKEQREYHWSLQHRYGIIPMERLHELVKSSGDMLSKLESQLAQINKLK